MVSIASGALANLGYGAEETFGTIPPSPQLTVLPRVSTSLGLKKDSYQSEVIKSNRMTQDLRHGVRRVGGDIVSHLAMKMYDPLIEGLMGGTWATGVTLSNTDLTSVVSDSATKKFTFAGGNPISLGLRVGDIINFASLAQTANNGKDFTILSFGGTSNREVTVAESVTTDNSPDSSFTVNVKGKKLGIGNTYRSFFFERAFTDISKYLVFKGCRMSQLAIDMPATGPVGCTFTVMGQDVDPMASVSIDSSYTDAPSAEMLVAVDGELRVNGTAVATVTGMKTTINNDINGKPVIGANTIPNMLFGEKQVITGEMTALFTDETFYNYFVNESEASLYFKFVDPAASGFIKMFMPRIKFSGGDIGDKDAQGLPITLPFQALEPTSTLTSAGYDSSALVWQRSNLT